MRFRLFTSNSNDKKKKKNEEKTIIIFMAETENLSIVLN